MGCPALFRSAAAPLSVALTGEPPGIPRLLASPCETEVAIVLPAFMGRGENEVRSEASLGAGGRDRGGMELEGLRGPGKPKWGRRGSDTQRGRAKSGGGGPRRAELVFGFALLVLLPLSV